VVSARIRRVPTQGIKLPPQHAGNQSLVQKVAANTGLLDPTKSSSCVGYVVFAHASTVERALELNNMEIPDPTSEHHPGQSKTRHIRVDRVRPVHDASRSVFVGNLPHSRTDEETLRQHVLKTCSLQNYRDDEDDPIEAVRVVRDEEFQCRGFAYVLLRDKSLVPRVLQQLSDSTYQGRQLRVQVCGKRFKNRRGQPKPPDAPEAALAPYSKRGRDNNSNNNNKKQRHRRGGDLVAAIGSASASLPSPMGALRRIMASQAVEAKSKSRRARGPTMASKRAAGPSAKSPHKVPKRAAAGAAASSTNVKSAGSKRSASQTKSHDRAKKIEKRMSRGMGKNKKSGAGR
jgi:nucleolar protein 12